MSKVGLRFITVLSFVVGFVGARTVVVLSVVVGERTTGTAFGIPITQLVFANYHIHHYFFGFVILGVVGWIAVFHESYSRRLVASLYGLGMGVFTDEIGMLLTGGEYYAVSTYFAAVTFVSIFFLALYWDLRRYRRKS